MFNFTEADVRAQVWLCYCLVAVKLRDALTDVSGYYQQDHGCKIIKAATSLIALCNQSNHSVVYTVAKCVLAQEI